MIGPADRGRMAIVAAGAFAAALPAWLLWPTPITLQPPRGTTLTVLRTSVAPSLAAALDRPLFSATRQPPPVASEVQSPEEASAAPTPAPQPVPRLSGTIAGRRGGVALVRTQAGETVRVRVGDRVDGWTVLAIADRRVLFEQDGRRETARLEFRSEGEADGPPSATVDTNLEGSEQAAPTASPPLPTVERPK